MISVVEDLISLASRSIGVSSLDSPIDSWSDFDLIQEARAAIRKARGMSHTPGPWEVAENLFGNTASYEVYANVETKSGKGGYTRICQITPRDQKANAHLIAAAPEMYIALQNVRVELDSYPHCPFCGSVHGEGHEKDCIGYEVEAAIRKARGEE